MKRKVLGQTKTIIYKNQVKQKYLYYFKLNFERQHCRNTNQEELKLLGNTLVQEERYEEAVTIYNAAIDIDPMIESAAPIYSNRSLCFMNLGRFQEAYDDGDVAAALRPGFPRGHLRRANAAMKLERWKESTESYEKYFELDPEGAKSDAEVVKNKNLAKKLFDQQEAQNKKHQQLVEKTRSDLMAIKDEKKRKEAAWRVVDDQQANFSTFDVDVVRVAAECGIDLGMKRYSTEELALLRKVKPNPVEKYSFLMFLLATRHEVQSKILPRLDNLILFVIDKMMKEHIDFVGFELGQACR